MAMYMYHMPITMRRVEIMDKLGSNLILQDNDGNTPVNSNIIVLISRTGYAYRFVCVCVHDCTHRKIDTKSNVRIIPATAPVVSFLNCCCPKQ